MAKRNKLINTDLNPKKSCMEAAFADVPHRSDLLDFNSQLILSETSYSTKAIRCGRIDLVEEIYVQEALNKES